MNFENLSEEDLYSDEEDIGQYGDTLPDGSKGIGGLPAAAERRAHHNALERKRRDHIKDSFTSLREAVPTLKGDKVKASRAQILKKAADYIGNLKTKNDTCESDIEEILKQNKTLLDTVRMIETRAQQNGIPLPPSNPQQNGLGLGSAAAIKTELTGTSVTPSGSHQSQAAGQPTTTIIKNAITPTIAGRVTATLPKSNSPTISTLKRSATSVMGTVGGGTATSVISGGGSGTVKLESHGKTITNPNKIFLVNSNYRTAGTAGTNTVVIPSAGSRLITANTIKNGLATTTTAGAPIKIIIQNSQPILKREH